MISSQPIVCVFLKFPPSRRPVVWMYEIAWDVFLPQLNRISEAFEAVQATHPSIEAKKIWLEAQENASEYMIYLQDITFTSHDTARSFLRFLKALQSGRDNSESYRSFRGSVSNAITRTGTAQEGLLELREEIRIVVGRITSILGNDATDISSFITESSQSLLELATGVEECNAILEEHREELKNVQRQSSDEKNNQPSEEEIRVVQEKWRAFEEVTGPNVYRWQALRHQLQGPDDSDESVMTSNNSTSPTMPTYSSMNRRIPFWRKFFQHTSCLSLEKFS
ncbi:hypothetical protein AGABI1DRAFT_128756 [Agaricus bisporus var. burnettii JB137-S8]|uniref:Uncharacterized protein n=1 Tax=Agaricus bisporus var. burnettii (strain JB137-S8 / ATCC MYA-4627 / FGSC 10392) TaxID=597362 RepID=K5WVZ0_AGABU|nr:uncharacterized protein AGABI1DRAFT_128756 [Agaricus bisporus var. burnettii JB137-S8]EKM79611.1 hypothetical protein AGABI1DRAFT_128756 [Agaricus bisporus var. burnettii JB137-S8]